MVPLCADVLESDAESLTLARTERRALLLRMAVALLAMMQVMMFAIPQYLSSDGVAAEQQRLLEWASFVLTLPALVYSAAPFFRGAWRDVVHLRLGMDVPVALGIGAAFAASAWATFTGSGAVYYDARVRHHWPIPLAFVLAEMFGNGIVEGCFSPGRAHRAPETRLHGALVLIDGVHAHQKHSQQEPCHQSKDNTGYDLHIRSAQR